MSRTLRGRRILVCTFAAAASLAAPARAVSAQAPLDSLVVSVLTMGPGNEVFERFGHQSVRIHNVTTGVDSAYNWGMFSFDQPHFLVRFLTGDTKYWMQGFPSQWLIAAYRGVGRSVWEQVLAMTPAQKDSLRRLVEWNARDENKWYRYDYYRDNCATRVRDALDMVLGGAIRRAVVAHEHGVTYRSETLRLARAYPLINFGMDFVLGRPADMTLSAWEEMFVPMRLQQLLRGVVMRRPGGAVERLVQSERELVADPRYAESDAPPDYFAPALAVGLAAAGMLLALCLFPANGLAFRWGVGILGTLWSLLAGVVGMLLLAAELFTRHAAYMGHNVNVLLATPASLALAVLIPVALARRSSPRVRRAVRALGFVAAAFALAAMALRLVPSLAQQNRPLLALAVPVHAALALALWRAAGAWRKGAA